ncbi:nascent polypeptide-associated complex subunit alpha, muscle-specific form-like [Anneissia japonica]|uniref:nascent polypeptide-associated complex subunit alpha, muscle-specific form-like n=1 Tax=Anneissia japonica TaxID=1529436 RepID=UPI00142591FB|nr:nascent polypeptide-associated complex subunit alpha, muscle-specific form-like [Anneissia japonica]
MPGCVVAGTMYQPRSNEQNSQRDRDLAKRMETPVLFTKSLPNRARVSSSEFKRFQNPKEAWATQKHNRTNTFPRSDAFRKNIDLESQFQTELSKCLFEKALERIESRTCADDIALLKSRHLSKNIIRPSSSFSYWSSQPIFEMSQSLWTTKTNCSDLRTSLNIKETKCKSEIVKNNEKFDTYFVNGSLDVRAVAKSRGPIETPTGNIHAQIHRIKSANAQNLHGHSLKYMYSDKRKEYEYRKMMKLYIDKPPPAPPPPPTPAERQQARDEALRILTEKLKAEEEEKAAKEAQLKKEMEEKAAAEAAAAAIASRPSSSGKTVTFNDKLTSTKIIGGRKKGSRRGSPARKPSPTTRTNSAAPKKPFPGSGRASPSSRKASPSGSPKPPSPKGNTKKKKGGAKGKKEKKKDKKVETVVTPPPEEPKPLVPEPEPLPEPIKPEEPKQPSEPKVVLLDEPPKYTPATEYKTRNKRVSDWLYSCSSAASGTYQPFL